MSRREKLLQKLYKKPPPKDFTWSELQTLLRGYGFEMLKPSGGAGRKFVNRERRQMIILHEPHPEKTLKVCYISEVVKKLKKVGIQP